jgi:hypothetical protein
MSQEVKHLFRKKPTVELVEEILRSQRFTGFGDSRLFQKDDIDLGIFEEWLPILEPYYLPCKAKLFLHNFNAQKAITVIRHLLRANGYKLRTYEKVNKGRKQTYYQLEQETWMDLSGSLLVAFN